MPYAFLIRGRDAAGRVLASVFEEFEDPAAPSRAATAWGTASQPRVFLSLAHDAETGEETDVELSVALLPELGRLSPTDRHVVKIPSMLDARPLPPFEAGDVVFADGIGRPDPEDRERIAFRMCDDPAVLGRVDHAADPGAAARLVAAHMASREDGRRMFRETLDGQSRLSFEASAGRASEERNEVLLFTWRREDGSLESSVVHATGGFMFWEAESNGDKDASSVQEPDGPGLWMLENGKSWVGHDYETGVPDDWGLEGDFRAVTPEEGAAHFGIPLEGILADMEDAYPYIHDGLDLLEAVRLRGGDPDAERDEEEAVPAGIAP